MDKAYCGLLALAQAQGHRRALEFVISCLVTSQSWSKTYELRFGQLTIEQMAFSQMAFGQMAFCQMAFGQRTVGQMAFGQMAFSQRTLSCPLLSNSAPLKYFSCLSYFLFICLSNKILM